MTQNTAAAVLSFATTADWLYTLVTTQAWKLLKTKGRAAMYALLSASAASEPTTFLAGMLCTATQNILGPGQCLEILSVLP